MKILLYAVAVLAHFALFLAFGWLWSPRRWAETWAGVLGH